MAEALRRTCSSYYRHKYIIRSKKIPKQSGLSCVLWVWRSGRLLGAGDRRICGADVQLAVRVLRADEIW